MKKITLLIISMLLTSCFSSKTPIDGKCEYVRNEVDHFAKKHVKETKYYSYGKSGFGTAYINVSGLKIENTRFLQISLVMPGNAFNLMKGDHFYLLDKNENVTKLEISETKTSDIAGNKFYAIEKFLLNDSIYKTLKETNFIELRYETMDGFLDFRITRGQEKALSFAMNCIE